MSQVRVRFAPSPTGILHVGGIRTALFNYFFAKSQNGVFILRNEDTDQARKVEGSLEATLESLKWLGVSWDELVTQSERLENYKTYAHELVSKGLAKEEDGAIRFITPKEGITTWHDAIGNKEISFENENIEDFIILKKDGFPTYHLANVIDDHLMEISHVIRGEDWIPSAPKHIMLYNAFGWKMPVFAHVPNVLGTDGKKLSKRRGAKSVLDFKSEGILPGALLNYLMLLGWSPKDDREILSTEEIEKEFSLDKVNVAPSIFDERKLLWMNGEYIRMASDTQLKEKLSEFYNPDEEFIGSMTGNTDTIDLIVPLSKTRMKTLKEFRELAFPFLSFRTPQDGEDVRKKLYNAFEKIDEWSDDEILNAIKSVLSDNNIRFQDIYLAITGIAHGLPLVDIFSGFGKEKTLKLLK